MRYLALFCILMLLAGCSHLMPTGPLFSSPEPIPPQEQVLFNQALDQLTATQSPSELRAFRQRFPGGDWQLRAETIIRYVEELSLRKEQLEQLTAEQQQLQVENQQLVEKIEQLKLLLIELEQHPQ